MQGTGTVEVRVDMKKIKTMQIAGVFVLCCVGHSCS